MTNRRDFLKKMAAVSVAGMLPGSTVSPGHLGKEAMTESDSDRLRRLCLEKLPDRFEQACFPQAIRRLNHELAILDSVGRASSPQDGLA